MKSATVTDASPDETATLGEVLHNANFTVYFVCAFVSNAGTFMQQIGVPFVMYDLTHRNAWVGASVFAGMVPSMLMSPFAGTLSDRVSRRAILMGSNLVQLSSAVGLWLLAVAGEITPWRIIALLVVAGFALGFQNAVAHALVPLLVPPRELIPALRLNSVNYNIARVLGPLAASLVLTRWGYTATFGVNALSFLFVLFGLAYVHPRAVVKRMTNTRWYADFADAWAYVRERATMRHMMAFSIAVSMLGASTWQLGAGVVAEVYHADEKRLGMLIAVFGAGAVVAGLSMIAIGDRLRRSRATMLAIALYGTGAVTALATHRIAVGIVGFAIMGTAHSIGAISSTMSLQLQVAEDFRGRVLSLFVMFSFIGVPIGSIVGGRLGDAIGLQPTLLGFGTILLIYAAVLWVRFDALACLDEQRVPV
jgi:MFS family permease